MMAAAGLAQPPPGHRNHHHHHQSTPGEARSGETPDTLKRFYNRAEDSGWDRDALKMLDLDGSFSQPDDTKMCGTTTTTALVAPAGWQTNCVSAISSAVQEKMFALHCTVAPAPSRNHTRRSDRKAAKLGSRKNLRTQIIAVSHVRTSDCSPKWPCLTFPEIR